MKKRFFFILVVSLYFQGCASQNTVPIEPIISKESSHNIVTLSAKPQQQVRYPNTVAYWRDWASLRMRFNEKIRQLGDSPEDNLEYAKLHDSLATQTLSISQLGVEPKLISLAIKFTEIYRNRIRASKYTEELRQMRLAHKERSESWETYAEAAIRGAFGDAFGVSNELKSLKQKIDEKQDEYNKLIEFTNTKFNDLVLLRNHLRIHLSQKYDSELPE